MTIPNFVPQEGVRVDINGNRLLRWNLSNMVKFETEAKKILLEKKLIGEGEDPDIGVILDKYLIKNDILTLALKVLLESVDPAIDIGKTLEECKLSTIELRQAVYGACLMAVNPYQFQVWILQQRLALQQMEEAVKKMEETLTKQEAAQNTGNEPSTEASQNSDSSPGTSGG